MKKSTIVIVIVSIVMIMTGIGLFFGGLIATGDIAAAKESLAEHGVYLDDGFYIDINRSKNKGTSSGEKQHLNGEAVTFSIGDVRGLEIEADAAEIEIIQNLSTEEISVWADDKCEVYAADAVLHVETEQDLQECSIIIEISNNAVFENVDVSASACTMSIEYLETKEIELEVDAGQVIASDLTADNAVFDIGAGEIIIEYGNVQEFDVNVGMGNFEYRGKLAKRGNIDCGMGNAELQLKAELTDYNYEIDCAAGNVSVGEQTFSGVASKKTLDHHADAVIEVDCGMGNVSIIF